MPQETTYRVVIYVNGKDYHQRTASEEQLRQLEELSLLPFDIPKRIPPSNQGPVGLIIPAGANWHIEYRENE